MNTQKQLAKNMENMKPMLENAQSMIAGMKGMDLKGLGKMMNQLGGLFHDMYGSYDYAWYLAIALSVFAAIIHLPIREEPVLRLKTE